MNNEKTESLFTLSVQLLALLDRLCGPEVSAFVQQQFDKTYKHEKLHELPKIVGGCIAFFEQLEGQEFADKLIIQGLNAIRIERQHARKTLKLSVKKFTEVEGLISLLLNRVKKVHLEGWTGRFPEIGKLLNLLNDYDHLQSLKVERQTLNSADWECLSKLKHVSELSLRCLNFEGKYVELITIPDCVTKLDLDTVDVPVTHHLEGPQVKKLRICTTGSKTYLSKKDLRFPQLEVIHICSGNKEEIKSLFAHFATPQIKEITFEHGCLDLEKSDVNLENLPGLQKVCLDNHILKGLPTWIEEIFTRKIPLVLRNIYRTYEDWQERIEVAKENGHDIVIDKTVDVF